ncbi:MAG: segregation/condensation protein A, partial [Candidatus Sungbacteria bacterium]|nr:segregation/condensation protein A [Candidatus Sungbacteria bacterium]
MAFTIKQEQFEGPLDVLLDLIEKEKVSVNQISLASAADEYVRFVKTLTHIDREELAEFLVVAAQLILIKSRSLLPNTALSEEEAVSIEELERRLREYKRLKELSLDIKDTALAGRHIYTREFYSGLESVFYPPKRVTPNLL